MIRKSGTGGGGPLELPRGQALFEGVDGALNPILVVLLPAYLEERIVLLQRLLLVFVGALGEPIRPSQPRRAVHRIDGHRPGERIARHLGILLCGGSEPQRQLCWGGPGAEPDGLLGRTPSLLHLTEREENPGARRQRERAIPH